MKALDLFINNKCNFNCEYCTVDNSINKNYDFDLIKKIDFIDYDVINILGGEPTLHPDFIEIVKFIYNQNKNIIIFTNGTNLSKLKKIDYLDIKFIISLHYMKLKRNILFYKKIYLESFKSFKELQIILHPQNQILLEYFNNLLKKDKKFEIFTINNYFDTDDGFLNKILKLKAKYRNLNFSKILNLFKSNTEYLNELFAWKDGVLYKEDCDKSICTLKDHFIKNKGNE